MSITETLSNIEDMGCACSTSREQGDLTSEELLKTYADSLGWGDFSAVKIAAEVEAAGDKDFSQGQMERFLTNMRVRLPNFRDKSHPLTSLYNCLRVKNKYSRAKLALLGVLLGKGRNEQKCGVIDKFYEGAFGETPLSVLLGDICDLALTYLPMYTCLELQYVQDSAAVAKLGKYQQKLGRAKGTLIGFLEQRLAPDRESLLLVGELQTRLQDEVVQSLFSSRRLRTLAVSLPADGSKPQTVSMLKTPYISPSASPRRKRSNRFLTEEIVIKP